MKDISITDYLGPGVYLLYNYQYSISHVIANRGYKICYCNDLSSLKYELERNNVNFVLIRNVETKFDECIEILKQSKKFNVKKIFMDLVLKDKERSSYNDFINEATNLNYYLDASFAILNSDCYSAIQEEPHVRVVLGYSDKPVTICDVAIDEPNTIESKLSKIITFIRPGDRVLVLSKENKVSESIKHSLLDLTKASMVHTSSLSGIENLAQQKKSYHFILVNKCGDDEFVNILDNINTILLPTGRCACIQSGLKVINALEPLSIDLEVYYTSEGNILRSNIHKGEVIHTTPVLSVFMKSPLVKTSFLYEETIYRYDNIPKNLLAFARDYLNPWLLRGIVEFPFRNRSDYYLKKYSLQVLQCYPPFSSDYAAALAVLGYQEFNGCICEEHILEKIRNYCSGITEVANPTPHQYRWYISLSTLLGLIYNGRNDKYNALIHFSHAANSDTQKFSPSIGTKILQSLYFQAIILTSLNKISCAEIIIEKGISRGMQFLYQKPEELIGDISRPFNFVMFIYHEIIDWTIKLINLKNTMSGRQFNLLNDDNNNTWSALLHERMKAIDDMSRMIDERDDSIRSCKSMIQERDDRITEQLSFIDSLTSKLNVKEEVISGLLHDKNKIVALNNNQELKLNQLYSDLERSRETLNNINKTPVIGFLIRILNIQ